MYENIIYLSIYSLFNIKTLIKIISLLLEFTLTIHINEK